MKTWTNPTVEELEIKKTALFNLFSFAEYEQNGVFEPGRVFGDPDAGSNEGSNEGTNEGTDEGTDDAFGAES